MGSFRKKDRVIILGAHRIPGGVNLPTAIKIIQRGHGDFGGFRVCAQPFAPGNNTF
jgi:hypothetical protein